MKVILYICPSIIISIFISHMVQMKVKLFSWMKKGYFTLYPTWFRWKIKTLNQKFRGHLDFISHMVQMKGPEIVLAPSRATSFISHMVQMKVKKIYTISEFETALYPTWFRWKIKCPLFIKKTKKLYIPHGSDESFELVIVCNCSCVSFISHMVQMKVFLSTLISEKSLTLYPTWFRWKFSCPRSFPKNPWLYIPHGSDERNLFAVTSFKNPLQLYIPHGSDESRLTLNLIIYAFSDFISHMVQMKDESSVHAPNIRAFTLYPTWFRWKRAGGWKAEAWETDFISHMVQMKVKKQVKNKTFTFTLYPTWFRWKFWWYYIFFCQSILYIPHGSDESIAALCFCPSMKKLYIPHGSDERLHLLIPVISFPTLYPTWFRWK